MKWFSNLRIRWKLLVGFGMVLFLTFALTVVALVSLSNTDERYTYLLNFTQKRFMLLESIREDFTNMRRVATATIVAYNEKSEIEKYTNQFDQLYYEAVDKIDECLEINSRDTTRDPQILTEDNKMLEDLKTLFYDYKTQIMSNIAITANEGNFSTAVETIYLGDPIVNNATEIIDELCERSSSFLNETSDFISYKATFNINLLRGLSVAIYILSIAVAIFISMQLTKPLGKLLNIMNNLVEGDLNINKTEASKDEIGRLTLATYNLTDTILLLTSEMESMGDAFEKGDIEARINELSFSGSYNIVAKGLNDTVSNLLKETFELMECLKEFGNGNFRADIRKLPGKKAIINENLNTLRYNLKLVADDIGKLVNDASDGKLSERADTKKYRGDWAELLNSLNKLLEAIVAPINETTAVLRLVSKGQFDLKVEGDYKGDFLVIKKAINETVENTASYINEISKVLNCMANDDLDQAITAEYIGKYSDIKTALNNIINKFNRIISDILSSAEQVAAGSKQVSDTSMMLAEGASKQAVSIKELNEIITEISSSAMENAENAKNAEELAITSQNNAKSGNSDMNEMLTSMEKINNSSDNIAKIIKVIEDIASQTNLLALNAAVEAARAAEYGKGFGVVAEEVRNLAGRSQTSAKDTADLIEESIRTVKGGIEIANTTSNALCTILDDVEKVASIIIKISDSSKKQESAINSVTLGVAKITEVVESNSATSEEGAAASEQLASQAQVLKELLSVFKLKRHIPS